MSEVNESALTHTDDSEIFQMLQKSGDFEIAPSDGIFDIANNSSYAKVNFTPSQKAQVASFIQHLPTVMAANTMSKAYVLKFPEGFPHTLMRLKDGGLSTPIVGENGRILAHASIHPLTSPVMLMHIFSAMSIATGQYFLATINSELRIMNLNIDKILEFLYGDKKAELMSEISFVKYAYQNFSSIMAHEPQRVATIASLQDAKKIAMKDLEFYLCDLESAVSVKTASDIVKLVNNVFHIKESLDLSMQLYITSNVLETYYAQNYDVEYIQFIKNEAAAYVDKFEKRMVAGFTKLNMLVSGYKSKFNDKIDPAPMITSIASLIATLSNTESAVLKILNSALPAHTGQDEYYITKDGSVYMKTAS